MKMIRAVIQPFRLDQVRAALQSAGVEGLSVTECEGHGRQGGLTPAMRAGGHMRSLAPKLLIEIVIPSQQLHDAIDAISQGARVGNAGDGKIFVSSIEQAVSIRTA